MKNNDHVPVRWGLIKKHLSTKGLEAIGKEYLELLDETLVLARVKAYKRKAHKVRQEVIRKRANKSES